MAADGAWNKLKATIKNVTALVVGTPLFKASLYMAAVRGVRALVVETGSLEAAMRKLVAMQLYARSLCPAGWWS